MDFSFKFRKINFFIFALDENIYVALLMIRALRYAAEKNYCSWSKLFFKAAD